MLNAALRRYDRVGRSLHPKSACGQAAPRQVNLVPDAARTKKSFFQGVGLSWPGQHRASLW